MSNCVGLTFLDISFIFQGGSAYIIWYFLLGKGIIFAYVCTLYHAESVNLT
jgi:hypothetical protein